MGLDVSYDAWHGAYSAFMRWRSAIAVATGVPLALMEGYWQGTVSPVADPSHLDPIMEWLKPRHGGPLCQSHYGPVLYREIAKTREWLPIRWATLRRDPLNLILNHSDCEGSLNRRSLPGIARRLRAIVPDLAKLDEQCHAIRLEQAKHLIVINQAAPVGSVKIIYGYAEADRKPISDDVEEAARQIEQHGYGIDWPKPSGLAEPAPGTQRDWNREDDARRRQFPEWSAAYDAESLWSEDAFPSWMNGGHIQSHVAAAERFANGCDAAYADGHGLSFG